MKGGRLTKSDREHLYANGYMFIRKRKRTLSHKQQCFGAGEFGLFVSKKFGSWKLINWFDTEEECDRDIQDFVANYNKVVVE